LTGALAERLAALGRDDPDGLATSMLSEMVGALVLARSFADPARSDAILAASRRGLKIRLGLDT
jgi:TetR/AcrR family transcriptional repressor of nem operon